MELLIWKTADEYAKRGKEMKEKQDIGERRALRMEIQEKHGLTELQAINIINNRNIKDYVAIARRKWEEEEKESEKPDNNDTL